MKRLVIVLWIAAVFLASGACQAENWNYYYGGIEDPQRSGWVLQGNNVPPVWYQLTETGSRAIVIKYDDAYPGQGKYYTKTVAAGHVGYIWHYRFKIKGGAPTTAGQLDYVQLLGGDGRSNLERVSDAAGGTGDDLADTKIPLAAPPQALKPYDSGWHDYWAQMITSGPTSGCYTYLDGQFAHFRPQGLEAPAYETRFGFIQGPPAGFPDAELWIDYVQCGYNDNTVDSHGSKFYGWGYIIGDAGTCTGAAAQVLTDSTKSWTTNDFADDWLIVAANGGTKWLRYRIVGNGANTITVLSGNMLADGVQVGDSYRIVSNTLMWTPGDEPDGYCVVNRILNPEFDASPDNRAGKSMRPTNYQVYPLPPDPVPLIPEYCVWNAFYLDSRPYQTNRMYGVGVVGDATSEPRDYYLYQTYTTVSPYDALPATYYANAMAMTFCEGGAPENSRIRVGLGKNLVPPDPLKPSEYDPNDPNIVWADWISTQGYPWQRTPSAQMTADNYGDKLTMFIHFNQQQEFEGKTNIAVVDRVCLDTVIPPTIQNVQFYPTNADCTQWHLEWDTDMAASTELLMWGYIPSHVVPELWYYGTAEVTHHSLDTTPAAAPDVFYNYSIKANQFGQNLVRGYDTGHIQTGPTIITPRITGGPTVDTDTATISWTTNIPATTEADFNPRGVGDVADMPWRYVDNALTTDHHAVLADSSMVTLPYAGLTPMEPGEKVYWRVKSRSVPGGPYAVCSAYQSTRDFHTGTFVWNPVPFTGTIGELRAGPRGRMVSMSDKVVTGTFMDENFVPFFYMEELDRSAGIKVASDAVVATGDLVDVDGIMQLSAGEKQILASSVTSTPGGTPPRPLGVTNASIAKGFAGSGAETQGLLVAAYGKVTWVDPIQNIFYIDDGTGHLDGTTHDAGSGPEPNRGIRVHAIAAAWGLLVDDYVIITQGCVGGVYDETVAVPIIWVESDAYVVKLF